MNPAYKPMLAILVDEPFDDKKWVFETKWDGFRLITEKRGHSVRLWSRNGVDVATSTRCSCQRFKRPRGNGTPPPRLSRCWQDDARAPLGARASRRALHARRMDDASLRR